VICDRVATTALKLRPMIERRSSIAKTSVGFACDNRHAVVELDRQHHVPARRGSGISIDAVRSIDTVERSMNSSPTSWAIATQVLFAG